MQSTTIYSRGDVVLVPFQFTDRAASKTRPAVVLSSHAYHQSRSEVVLAGITSTQRGLVGEVTITDWRGCGLIKPSVISGIVQTVRGSQIRERIGTLSSEDLSQLDLGLRAIVGL